METGAAACVGAVGPVAGALPGGRRPIVGRRPFPRLSTVAGRRSNRHGHSPTRTGVRGGGIPTQRFEPIMASPEPHGAGALVIPARSAEQVPRKHA